MNPVFPFQVLFIEPAGPHTDHLRQLLQFEGLEVTACGADERGSLPGRAPHLVVLNHARLRSRTLPLAHTLVASGARRPLTLALVAQGDELHGIELVERGIDSFLSMPCGSREFVARVRAMLRRVEPASMAAASGSDGPSPGAVRMRHLDIDPARRRVRAAGHDVRLTEQEFQLLYVLAGHPGRVFDRQALLDAVWGTETFVTTRSVDALVKRLRHQLRPALKSACVVETVRGVGYRLAERPSTSARPVV